MTAAAGGWSVEWITGSAAEVHAREISADMGPTVWVVNPTDRSIVLGSTQRESDVDVAAAHRHRLAITRRRSGGGAVLVTPESMVWVDVIVPRSHPAWTDDIGRAAVWMGERWAEALAAVGVEGTVLQPPMPSDELARVVCFVGRGPGEVVIGDTKVVGISQRRTRDAARFQCAVLRSWEPEPLIDAMGLAASDADRVRSAGAGLDLAPEALVAALIDALG